MMLNDDVVIDVEQINETIKKLRSDERLPITITVFIPEPYHGRDRFYFNIIKVRYPNVGRKKGEPSEIEDFHKVFCINGNIITKDKKSNLITPLPDKAVIDTLINNYQQYGEVTVIRNDLHRFRVNQSGAILVYPDNSKYDLNLTPIKE